MSDRLRNEREAITNRDDAVSQEPQGTRLASAGDNPSAPKPQGPDKSPFLKPSMDTLIKWKALVPKIAASPPGDAATAQHVIDILLQSRSGQTLVDDLHSALSVGGSLASTIKLDFRTHRNFPADEDGVTHPEAAAFYTPGNRRARVYTVYVDWDLSVPGGGSFTISSIVSGVSTKIASGTAMMVESLFHEMLHVWFINSHRDKKYGPDEDPQSGHTTYDEKANRYDFIEPEFHRRIVEILRELESMEAYRATHPKSGSDR